MGLLKIQNAITQEKAVTAATISTIIKSGEVEESVMMVIITTLIINTAEYMNVGRNMNEDQCLETASLMLNQFKHETIEDFVLMFKNAKTGKYGTTFNRLDGQVIFEWFYKYLDEKARYRETVHAKIKQGGVIIEDLQKKIIGEKQNTGMNIDMKIKAMKIGLGIDPEKSIKESDDQDFNTFKISYLKDKIIR